MPKKTKPYTRKSSGKKFELIGEGHEAKVWRVSGTEKKRKLGRIFRSTKHKKQRTERDLLKRFIAQTIAHELFPKNVTKPTEIDLKKRRIRFKERKMNPELEQIYVLWEQLRRKQQAKNPTGKERKILRELENQYWKAYQELNKAYQKSIDSINAKKKEFDGAGFDFESDALNVSVANPKEPVFYEVMKAYPTDLEHYLKKRKLSKKKKEKIEKLIAEYRSI